MSLIDRVAGRFVNWLVGLVKPRKTYSMAIVRRYTDANGAFVGELYLLGTFCGALQYNMIGVSLDTLPFDCHEIPSVEIDTKHDFLSPIAEGVVRVGALDPRDNQNVKTNVERLVKEGRIHLQIQNRFVEHVMQSKPSGQGDK